MEVFEMLAEAFRPENQRPIRTVAMKKVNGDVMVELSHDIQFCYSRHFKTVSVTRGGKLRRADDVDDDYTLNEFLDDIEFYQKYFNL